MSTRWLVASMAFLLGGCLCADDHEVRDGTAPRAKYAAMIDKCTNDLTCAPLCADVFHLDASDDIVGCRVMVEGPASVQLRVHYIVPNVCAADDSDTWDDGWDDYDDSGDYDDGGYDDGDCSDSSCDDGSGDGSGDDDDDGDDGDDDGDYGDDDGDYGDDGGDDGGGDDEWRVVGAHHTVHASSKAPMPTR